MVIIFMEHQTENQVDVFLATASRGVACVLAARKRALVYILDEDEDEISDSE